MNTFVDFLGQFLNFWRQNQVLRLNIVNLHVFSSFADDQK